MIKLEKINLKRFGMNGKFIEERFNAYWYWITLKANYWWYGNYFIMSLKEYSKEEILEKVRLNFPDLYRRLPTNIDGSISVDECIREHPYFEILDFFTGESIIFEQTILFIGKNGDEHLNGYYCKDI